jgi:hypothetical protein
VTFTHKIGHANDRDEISIQTRTRDTLNIEWHYPATAEAVGEAVNHAMAAIPPPAVHTYTAAQTLPAVHSNLSTSSCDVVVVGDIAQAVF